jgi:hypothetical protein
MNHLLRSQNGREPASIKACYVVTSFLRPPGLRRLFWVLETDPDEKPAFLGLLQGCVALRELLAELEGNRRVRSMRPLCGCY